MWIRRILISIFSAALLLGAVQEAAWAQQGFQGFPERRGPPPRQEKKPEPKRTAKPRPDPATQLNALFEALKLAPDATMARQIEDRIEALLARSGSPTADLLMTRAKTVSDAKDYDLSIKLLDSVVEIYPNFTEAYAQRATAYYLKKDLGRALADLRVVVAREPRHYTALSGLGIIFQDIGEDKRALDAYRRAVAVNPHIRGISEMMKKLEVKVEGRDI